MALYENDELVNVPIPKRYLMDVYQFLAAREQEATSSSTNQASKENRSQWWTTDERIVRLKREIKNETVFTLLDLTASQPMKWFSFEQVYQKAGRSSDQAKADLRGLTILIRQLFPNNAGGWWPVDILAGSPAQYRMHEEIAHQWNKG